MRGPNMSYCMWENTDRSLDQCMNELKEDYDYGEFDEYFKTLSTDEQHGLIRLCRKARDLLEYVEESDIAQETM